VAVIAAIHIETSGGFRKCQLQDSLVLIECMRGGGQTDKPDIRNAVYIRRSHKKWLTI
jgi:hypothetical protein